MRILNFEYVVSKANLHCCLDFFLRRQILVQ